ncbi:MAG: hypothetical protein Q3979_03795 [Actinomycetaceae bacterium]|nr:hypothetical protein [Actinomycetaceae bacterium]
MTDDYLEELDGHLQRLGVARRQREFYTREIGNILDEGVDLGEPDELAEQLAEQLADPAGVNALADTPWEPAQHTWLAKRRLGKGAVVNWGKVAVELGLILPDEVDDEVLAAIPAKLVETLRWMPTAIAAAATATGAVAVRRGVRVPMRTSLTGRIKKTAPPWSALALAGASVALAASTLGPRARADTKTLLLRSADATSFNAAFFAQIWMAFSQRNGRVHPAALYGWSALVLAVQAAILILPTRAGRARVA